MGLYHQRGGATVTPAVNRSIQDCLGFVDCVTLLEQDHCELVGLEKGVEFFAKINCVTRIAEADFFVLGTGIAYQNIMSF